MANKENEPACAGPLPEDVTMPVERVGLSAATLVLHRQKAPVNIYWVLLGFLGPYSSGPSFIQQGFETECHFSVWAKTSRSEPVTDLARVGLGAAVGRLPELSRSFKTKNRLPCLAAV